jgi:glutathione synthase/RimK-type ligase-like ATP-grasp enzyme
MILLITNKDDVTVDYVVQELQKTNIPYYRLNTEDIPNIVSVDFDFDRDRFLLHDSVKNVTVDLSTVTSVYFRRPRITSLSYMKEALSETEHMYLQREAAQILEGIYKILEDRFWLNNVYRIREAENKLYQLRLAKRIGFTIPETVLSNDYTSVKKFLDENKCLCIIKPVRSGGMGERADKVIFTSRLDEAPDGDQIQAFPLYTQRLIEKQADLRIITIGDHIYCAKIDSQAEPDARVDWRRGSEHLRHSVHELPESIKQKCFEITHALGLNYSAIDLILTPDSKYVFLECNPNGQWAWLEERLGFPISHDIVNLLQSKGAKV